MNYVKHPVMDLTACDHRLEQGWDAIRGRLAPLIQEKLIATGRCLLVVDCYPGVGEEEVEEAFSLLSPQLTLCARDWLLPSPQLETLFAPFLTEDRVFGKRCPLELEACFDPPALAQARQKAEETKGLILAVGVGAALLGTGELLVVADLNRWETQLRLRGGEANWASENQGEPMLSKYKRGYFIQWPMGDRHKSRLFSKMDFIVDTNRPGDPAMVSQAGFFYAMDQGVSRPFRLVPYFDPGVWGGHWMQEKFQLDPNQPNFAWSFDGVPEENSLAFAFPGGELELPAMDLVLTRPEALLGQENYSRFGAEFPIRFDLLDTMGGENLSLQVHPLTEYIRTAFAMPYTQDESYYLLDAAPGACVYLGVKTGVEPEKMLAALEEANAGGKPFPAEEFSNVIPVKPHDHVLIPAGTIHCSGKDTMVLEVSATPYIFTFKLWDWNRLGTDGLPRPVHLEHGARNIRWERDTQWVEEQLIHRQGTLREEGGCKVERTGLHPLEFIETHRITTSEPTLLEPLGTVIMANLVAGEAAILESPTACFPPLLLHYAETCILPASLGPVRLSPQGAAKEIKLLTANVRRMGGEGRG